MYRRKGGGIIMSQFVKTSAPNRVVIIGAAGRDFHNFHTMYRDHGRGKRTQVVAFTAAQIPRIDDRVYPRELAGPQYPHGIPIIPESQLAEVIKSEGITDAVFSYSDVTYQHVMEMMARVNAAGAHFILPGAEETMITSKKPVIAVCAVRTGCGKSQTSRMLAEDLIGKQISTVAIRHPMPYGDLVKQAVQRFATYEDMLAAACTIEEMEEYEPYTSRGMVVYAGVDYGAILEQAEAEAQVVLWDGGNNDTPFYRPDLHITVVDPLRPGHELTYYPGLTNLTMAHVIIVNKVNSASRADLNIVEENIHNRNPEATVIHTNSNVYMDAGDKIRGKRVLVVEDGPTATHGGRAHGAGTVAARHYGADIISPLTYLSGSFLDVFGAYPHLNEAGILPAMGYFEEQLADLAATINAVPCDYVVSGTPIDLDRLLGDRVDKPILRVTYDSEEIGQPQLPDIVARAIEKAAKEKATLGES